MEHQEIIHGLKNGDEKTYIFLFREYYIPLCSYSRRYVGRKDIAEEIVSETFLKIWENRERITIESSVKAYLFQAVSNNSLYFLRKLKKEESLDQYFRNAGSDNIGFSELVDSVSFQSLIMKELDDQISEAINLLPPQQQKTFRLKRFEGKKNKEIARIMGLSVKTVEMHMAKALDNLRKNLKDYLSVFLSFLF